jgi:hypothetical protein
MYRRVELTPTSPENFEFPSEGKLSPDNRWVIMANLIRFSLNRVMAKLPSTSETAIAITFLVINLSTLLRQVFWAFLCMKWKNSTFSRSMITISYNL